MLMASGVRSVGPQLFSFLYRGNGKHRHTNSSVEDKTSLLLRSFFSVRSLGCSPHPVAAPFLLFLYYGSFNGPASRSSKRDRAHSRTDCRLVLDPSGEERPARKGSRNPTRNQPAEQEPRKY